MPGTQLSMSKCEVQRRNSNRWPRYVDQPLHLRNCLYCRDEKTKSIEEVEAYHSNLCNGTSSQLGHVHNISERDVQQQVIEERYQALRQKQVSEQQQQQQQYVTEEHEEHEEHPPQYIHPIHPRKSYRQYPIYDLITMRQHSTIRVRKGGEADFGKNWVTTDMKKETDREVTVDEIATLTTRDPKVLENSGLDRYEYRSIKGIIRTHNFESDARSVQYHWKLAGIMVGETYFIDDVKGCYESEPYTYDVDDLCEDLKEKSEMEGEDEDGLDGAEQEVVLTRKVQIVVKRIWIDRSMDNMSTAVNHNGAIPVWLTWPMPPASVEDKIIAKWKKRVKAAERMRNDHQRSRAPNYENAGPGVVRRASTRSGSSRHNRYAQSSQRGSRSGRPMAPSMAASSKSGSSSRHPRRYHSNNHPRHQTSHSSRNGSCYYQNHASSQWRYQSNNHPRHQPSHSTRSGSHHYPHAASSPRASIKGMTPSSPSARELQRSRRYHNNNKIQQPRPLDQDVIHPRKNLSSNITNSTATTIAPSRNQSNRTAAFTFNGLNYHSSPPPQMNDVRR